MTRLEEETRIGQDGSFAAQQSRFDMVVLDELGYLPCARSGGQLPVNFKTLAVWIVARGE